MQQKDQRRGAGGVETGRDVQQQGPARSADGDGLGLARLAQAAWRGRLGRLAEQAKAGQGRDKADQTFHRVSPLVTAARRLGRFARAGQP